MANGIILSILVPTITGREVQFNRLCDELNRQLQEYGIWNEVEIISNCDSREMSIGLKRQVLLNQSLGDFIVFIDDDDWVADDYCFELWGIIRQYIDEAKELDCIGFLQKCVFNGANEKLASLSNQWSEWKDDYGGYGYVRTPFFPTPIRRELAMKIGYKDLRFGEDYDFSVRLKESDLIKHEYFLNKVMYIYQYTHMPYKDKYAKPTV